MELHEREKSRRVLESLWGCHARLELMCIAVLCGGTRVATAADLPPLYREYAELVPSGGQDFVLVLVAHREVVRQLCRIRDSRGTRDCEALRGLRERHAAAVLRLAQTLARHGA